MRRFISYGLLASVIVLGGAGYSASAQPGGPCNGQVDTGCYYDDSQGNRRTCAVWVSGECRQVTVTHNLGGDCNGLVDVNCDDWSGRCTLWVAVLGCVIG